SQRAVWELQYEPQGSREPCGFLCHLPILRKDQICVTSNDPFEQIAAVDLSTVANIATALTVLTAVVFGLVEMRRARKERAERAAFVAVQAILTPAWIQSMTLVQAISEGTTPSQIEADARLFQAVQSIACILESLGYAVFARMVPLTVVDELLGGTVRVAWRNLGGYVEYERERAGSKKNWEWFQWLAQQIDRHSKARTSLALGADGAYRDAQASC